MHLRLPLALVPSPGLVAGTAAPAVGQDVPPPQPMQVNAALPPGNSGHFSVGGQARGQLIGDPWAYGDHVDDQRELF
jgi:hypothetical protein